MKRLYVVFLSILFFFLLFLPFWAFSDTNSVSNCFQLPLSLEVVEDEAFSGTAVETVFFPDGFLKVEEKAFDKAGHLSDIYIPETTEYIADSAFPISKILAIHGIDGSYAENWAYYHGIPFVVDNVWNVIVQSGTTYNTQTDTIKRYIDTLVLIILFGLFRLNYYEVRSRRPQDRPELNPVYYRFP